jgi:hypothetical protein
MVISAVSKPCNIAGFESEQMSSTRKHWLELNQRGSGIDQEVDILDYREPVENSDNWLDMHNIVRLGY